MITTIAATLALLQTRPVTGGSTPVTPIVFVTAPDRVPLTEEQRIAATRRGDLPILPGFLALQRSGVRYYIAEDLPELRRLAELKALYTDIARLAKPGQRTYLIGGLSAPAQQALAAILERHLPDADTRAIARSPIQIDAVAQFSVRWDQKDAKFGFWEQEHEVHQMNREQLREYRQQLAASAVPRVRNGQGQKEPLEIAAGRYAEKNAGAPWRDGLVLSKLGLSRERFAAARKQALELLDEVTEQRRMEVEQVRAQLTKRFFPTWSSYRPGGVPDEMRPRMIAALEINPAGPLDRDVARQTVNRMSITGIAFTFTVAIEVEDFGSINLDLTP